MDKYRITTFYSLVCKNTSKRLKNKQIQKKLGVQALTEKPTITGNALDLETGYSVKANGVNEHYVRNLKKIYDTGHDKYKNRKSVQNAEDKNNSENNK